MKFFVYGTLKPGHQRWGILEPNALEVLPAYVPGYLFDLTYFPGAYFNEDVDDVIPGYLIMTPRDETLLLTMDEIEGHPLLFRRKEVDVYTIQPETTHVAYAYEFVNAAHLEAAARIDSWHPERDEGEL